MSWQRDWSVVWVMVRQLTPEVGKGIRYRGIRFPGTQPLALVLLFWIYLMLNRCGGMCARRTYTLYLYTFALTTTHVQKGKDIDSQEQPGFIKVLIKSCV